MSDAGAITVRIFLRSQGNLHTRNGLVRLAATAAIGFDLYSAVVAIRHPRPYPWRMDFIAMGWGYVFSTVIALLPIVNPLSTVGVLLGITAGLSEQERIEQTRRACMFM